MDKIVSFVIRPKLKLIIELLAGEISLEGTIQ
jgi:hypothetical protein